MKKETNKNIGSDFDEFLSEQGIREEVEATAIKRVITFQLQNEMEKEAYYKNCNGKENAYKPFSN